MAETLDKARQIRDEMVKQLIEAIEKNPKAWEKGWVDVAGSVQVNGKTGKPYRGFNAFYLSLTKEVIGYKDPRWVTFNQAHDLGATVKKGEKSSPVLFFEYYDTKTKKEYDEHVLDGMSDEEKIAYQKENVRPLLKYSRVFNAEQCENFPEREVKLMSEEERAAQNEMIEMIITNSAAPINYDGGNRAYYSPSSDSIHLPEIAAFSSMEDFYATALHEIAHSTGHESRLNRDLSGGFGSASYAIEELRAEMASVFMQNEFGIELKGSHIENHAAYLSSWLEAVKKDYSILYKAAADAQRISDYVAEHYMTSVREEAAEQQQERAGEHKKENEEVSTKHIQRDMSDEERFEILKEKRLSLSAAADDAKLDAAYRTLFSDDESLKLEGISSNARNKLLRTLANEFGIFKSYKNADIELTFDFSRNNLNESANKQKRNYGSFAKMLTCFDDVVENAIGIEVHNRNTDGYKFDATLRNVYVLVSAFKKGDSITPVKLEIKEFNDKPNSLYIAIALEDIKKDEVAAQGASINGVAQDTISSDISIIDFLRSVNPSDTNFTKYFPEQVLTDEQRAQLEGEHKEKNQYGNSYSVYNAKGEFQASFTFAADTTEEKKAATFKWHFEQGYTVRNYFTNEEVTAETWRRAEGYEKAAVDDEPYYDARADIEAEKASVEREADESVRRHEEEQARLQQGIQEWYASAYPTDELAAAVDPSATFADLQTAIREGKDVYPMLAGDSVVRERAFAQLADIEGVSYDEIYNRWENGSHKEKKEEGSRYFIELENGAVDHSQILFIEQAISQSEKFSLVQTLGADDFSPISTMREIYQNQDGSKRVAIDSVTTFNGIIKEHGSVSSIELSGYTSSEAIQLYVRLQELSAKGKEALQLREAKQNDASQSLSDAVQSTSTAKPKWYSIPLPEGAVGKEYGSNTLIRMPKEGEYDRYSIFVPTKLIQKRNEQVELRATSESVYRLKNDGMQVELTADELQRSFAGETIGKEAVRVAPSKRVRESLERIEKNVPAEMKALPNWCCYKTRWNATRGKKDKFLISAVDGKTGVKRTDSSQWTTFDQALQYARENNIEGLSFAFDGKSGITCIDLDRCVNPETGEQSKFAAQLIAAMKDTYIERSASGSGYHIFVKDDIVKGDKYKNVASIGEKDTFPDAEMEVYDKNFIISFTGNMISAQNTLSKCPVEAMANIRGTLGEKKQVAAKAIKGVKSEYRAGSDSEVIDRIRRSKRGAEFEALYSGKGAIGNRSQDDMKMAGILAFFTNGDADQSLRIMKNSGLYRADKSDEYYAHTIGKAIENMTILPTYGAGSAPQRGNDKGGGNSH